MGDAPPLLSIGIPAYNRPQWFREALASVIGDRRIASAIEIIISDDSTGPECGEIAQDLLQDWPGPWQYQAHQPSLGMAQNWNHCIALAQGEYVLLLHDDDFLYPGAVAHILQRLRHGGPVQGAFLFGVRVVDAQGRERKRQVFPRWVFLNPPQALTRLLSVSSFVRFPAIVVRRDLYRAIGGFDETIGEPADLQMWVQVMGRSGLVLCPEITCAYRVHGQALTMGMFNRPTIQKIQKIFLEAQAFHLLDSQKLQQYQADFLHQFILAGTYRAMRSGDFARAKSIFTYLQDPFLQRLPFSGKWFLVKWCFGLVLLF